MPSHEAFSGKENERPTVLPGSPDLETATTGSGDDYVVFDTEDAVVSTGAGNDALAVGAG
ncbi:hypothetical protein [Mesorhizobium sp. A556]